MNEDVGLELGQADWMVEEQIIRERQEEMTVGDKNLMATNRHPKSARFHELLRICGETHDLKQIDYGRSHDPFANVRAAEEWDVPPWVGAMIRATDKVRRLQSYRRNGKLANEGARDAFIDGAVYFIIALVLWEEGEDGRQP